MAQTQIIQTRWHEEGIGCPEKLTILFCRVVGHFLCIIYIHCGFLCIYLYVRFNTAKCCWFYLLLIIFILLLILLYSQIHLYLWLILLKNLRQPWYIISNFVLWTWTITTIHLNSVDFDFFPWVFFLFSLKRFPWFPVIENNFGLTLQPQLQLIQLLHRLQFLLYSTYVDIHEYLFHDERDKKNNLLSYSNYTSKRLSKTLPIWIILP